MKEKKDKTEGKARKTNTSVVAVVLIFVFIVIILIVNTFCTLSVCRPDLINKSLPASTNNNSNAELDLSDSEKVQSSLLANCLSIIGISVAVWSSLSIVNSIDKKDFKKLNQDITIAEEEIEKMEKTINSLSDKTSGIKNTIKGLFLEELLKIPSIDIPSRYFYQQFSETDIPEEIVSSLLRIEQTFYQVYILHDAQDISQALCEKANEGITLISKAEEIFNHLNCNYKEKDLILLYFKQRRAEFIFYKGYENNGYNNFSNAVKIYEEIIEKFGCTPMPESNADFIVPPLVGKEAIHRELKIYFANTLGEAHSKIIDNYSQIILDTPSVKEKMNQHINNAVFYCKCATSWESEKFDKPEVYYRNLGCAYERWDRICGFGNHANEIIRYYKKAFAVMNFDERPARIKNVYHTLLSYYHKYFNEKYNLFSTENSFITQMTSTDIVLLKEFYEYSMFAKEHFSKNNLPYVMNGFALVNILKIKEINNIYFTEFTSEYCLKSIESDLLYLQMLQINDEYTKELQCRYNYFKES